MYQGGPSVSGVDYVLSDAELFREVLGPQFDLVGFDPRGELFRSAALTAVVLTRSAGVGQTTPDLTMFKDASEAAQVLSSYSVNANESVSSIGRNFALFEIINNLASDRVKTLSESVGTPAVARDMLSIVQAFGQDKLQYWGIS